MALVAHRTPCSCVLIVSGLLFTSSGVAFAQSRAEAPKASVAGQAQRTTGPANVEVAPPDRALRNIGIGVAVGGAVVSAAGGTLFGYSAVSREAKTTCSEGCGQPPRWMLLSGLGAMGVGAVAVAAGLILILENDEPSYSATPSGPASMHREPPHPAWAGARWIRPESPGLFTVEVEF